GNTFIESFHIGAIFVSLLPSLVPQPYSGQSHWSIIAAHSSVLYPADAPPAGYSVNTAPTSICPSPAHYSKMPVWLRHNERRCLCRDNPRSLRAPIPASASGDTTRRLSSSVYERFRG